MVLRATGGRVARCSHRRGGVAMIRQVVARLALSAAWLGLSSAAMAQDSRRAYDADSPAWLAAVGALSVPVQKQQQGQVRHFIEDCSATLLTRSTAKPARIIVTAWHCIEHYHDLSRPIGFTLQAHSGHSEYRTARVLRQGGGMHADWAILQLATPIPAHFATGLTTRTDNVDAHGSLSMAGFSGDAGMGENGTRLTFDPACRVTQARSAVIDTDCSAFKGASGGAVVQVDAQGEARYVGVISEGDSQALSRFVAITAFRTALEAEL